MSTQYLSISNFILRKDKVNFSLRHHENINSVPENRQRLIKLIPHGADIHMCKTKTVKISFLQITQMFIKKYYQINLKTWNFHFSFSTLTSECFTLLLHILCLVIEQLCVLISQLEKPFKYLIKLKSNLNNIQG